MIYVNPQRLCLSFMALVLAVVASPAAANSEPGSAGATISSLENTCLAEARRAEILHGIPSGLLQSITRVEAGRKTSTGEFMPWQWTLNDRGEGLFFDTREAAMTYLEAAVAKPDHSVDVGCMQVNTKWHLEAFYELADMMDPSQNAEYAAIFLLDLHAAHKSWDEAVKHYHSSDASKNVRYHQRVLAELEVILAANMATAQAEQNDPEQLVEQGSREGEITVPVKNTPPASPPAQTITNAATTPNPDQSPDDLRVKGKQPYLARQWNRVEHFRTILANESS